MSVPVGREVMCIIERFVEKAPPGKYPREKENALSLVRFLFLVNTQD